MLPRVRSRYTRDRADEVLLTSRAAFRRVAVFAVAAACLIVVLQAHAAGAATTSKPYAANVVGPDAVQPHQAAAGASTA